MSGALPPVPVEVLYVDPSPSGRAAFVATHARTLRVCATDGADLDGLDGAVVFVRDRGGPTAELLAHFAGRQRVLVVDREGALRAAAWNAERCCEQLLVLPAPAAVVTLVARAAAAEAARACQTRELVDRALDRDRLAVVARQRGELLHDLANLTTAVSVDLQLLERSLRGGPHHEDVQELVELGHQILSVHHRSRATSRDAFRDPQALPFAEVRDRAVDEWKENHPDAPALVVDRPEDLVVVGDRLDLVRLLVALGELCVRGGVPPRVAVAETGPAVSLVPDGVADPGDLAFTLATRLVEANDGRWAIDEGSLVCTVPGRP